MRYGNEKTHGNGVIVDHSGGGGICPGRFRMPCGIIAAGAAFAPAASVCLAYAAEAPALDQTKLLDDLDEIDLSAYPKNESGTVTLLNFAEFGYAQIPSESDFGIYLYVYNPSERELSERNGANTVNMAVAYESVRARAVRTERRQHGEYGGRIRRGGCADGIREFVSDGDRSDG